MRQSRGFTLVELIIVITLIGAMVAIAIPSMTNWSSSYQLKAATRDLYSAALKARSEAAKRHANCALTFNIAGQDYIVYVDAERDFKFDGTEEIILQQTLPAGIRFDTSKGGGDGLAIANSNDTPAKPSIVFRPNGIPIKADPGLTEGDAYLINNKGDEKSVHFGFAGNVRIN